MKENTTATKKIYNFVFEINKQKPQNIHERNVISSANSKTSCTVLLTINFHFRQLPEVNYVDVYSTCHVIRSLRRCTEGAVIISMSTFRCGRIWCQIRLKVKLCKTGRLDKICGVDRKHVWLRTRAY